MNYCTTHTFFTNIIIHTFFVLLIILVIWISFLQFQSPKVLPVTAKDEHFSAERAVKYLEDIAVKPRPLNSEEHERVRDYLMETLTTLGLSPEIQKTEGIYSEYGIDYEGILENIVVRITGEDSSGAILISSHYDTVASSPGAADAGSSVAAILETVRALSHTSKLKNDVIILITDGEEYGLLGAKSFVNQHPWAKEIGVVFNFEARGNMGPSILFETSDSNDRLISEFIQAAPNPIAHSYINNLYTFMPNNTDLTVFKEAGMYGLNFAFIEGLNAYHTADDTIKNLSKESVQHHGDNMLNLVKHFGNLDLVAKKEGNRIFFNIVGYKVANYSEKLVIPLMILALLAFIVTFISGIKLKRFNVVGTIGGFLLYIFTVLLAYYIGLGLWKLLSNLSIEKIYILETNIKVSNPFLGSLLFLHFLFLTVIYRLAIKKINVFNLTIGANFGWLILLVISSIYFESSSYIFLWPYLSSLIGLNLVMRLKKSNSLMGSFISIIFAIPALLVTAPVIYIVYIMFTLKKINVLLALSTLAFAFLIPYLSNLKLNKQT